MARDPIANIVDAPLFIVPRVLDRLREYRALPKFDAVPDDAGQRARLAGEIERLVDRLLEGIERHPTKFWVLRQFQKTLEAFESEEAALPDAVRAELEKLMDLLGIDSSDGVLGFSSR